MAQKTQEKLYLTLKKVPRVNLHKTLKMAISRVNKMANIIEIVSPLSYSSYSSGEHKAGHS